MSGIVHLITNKIYILFYSESFRSETLCRGRTGEGIQRKLLPRQDTLCGYGGVLGAEVTLRDLWLWTQRKEVGSSEGVRGAGTAVQ